MSVWEEEKAERAVAVGDEMKKRVRTVTQAGVFVCSLLIFFLSAALYYLILILYIKLLTSKNSVQQNLR